MAQNTRDNIVKYMLDTALLGTLDDSLIDLTLGDLLDGLAREQPEVDGLVNFHRGIRWSYAEFCERVNRTARGLLAMGVGKGDHVAIWAYNYPEWLLTMFATAKIGAVLVTVNTNYKQFELEYLMRQSDSCTLVMMKGTKHSDYLQHIYGLCPELKDCAPGQLRSRALPMLKNVILIEDEPLPGMWGWSQLEALAQQVPESQRAALQATLCAHDVVNMQYTSGTTGFPKGVMLTHYNILNDGKAIGDCMRFSPRDRLLIHVPLFHCFGCVLGVMACVTHGTTIVLEDYFHPVRAMETIQGEGCTAVHGVPTMFISMLGHPDFPNYDFSSLRTGIMAGSPCPTKVMRQVVERMNMREITISYGQTESSPVITMTRTEDSLERRVSTIGRKLPHMEVKIVDIETGQDVAPNVTGEIWTRGYQVMKGYYNMPEATRNAIDEQGWLHTGDLGTVDGDGYFKITGRLKDMIIRGGENVYPREIEEYLYTHPDVQDVQVVGVPDEKYGEEVLAFIILRKGAQMTEEQAVQFIKDGLARHKAPRYVKFIDEYPMTASGKIQKFKLRELAIDLLGLQEAASVETA